MRTVAIGSGSDAHRAMFRVTADALAAMTDAARPGMVLFLHAILIDAPQELAMSLGHTIVIGETGAEVLSKRTPEYTVRP